MGRIVACRSQCWHLTQGLRSIGSISHSFCTGGLVTFRQAGANDLRGVGMERLSCVSTGGAVPATSKYAELCR
jgi:hypothetical protein